VIIDKFEKIINYKFKNESLLIEALTHSSSSLVKSNKKKKNYERLEFLGDRVLGLVLAEYFFKLFPDSNEGFLNDYFQKYANQDFLSQFAKKIQISDFIKTQKGDNLDNNKSVLSDVIESLIGAIYLDSNIDECRKFIVNNMLKIVSETDHPIKHSKSLLQEFCLDQFKQLPKYSMVDKSGPDHMPVFTVSVNINEKNAMLAKGSNLRNAEENAASKLLAFLKI
jgi:ribonuclease-3